MKHLDLQSLPSPCFVVDEVALEENLRVLADVRARSGAKVLLALKAFAMWSLAPLVSRYLSGTCASGLHEAMLGHELFAGETHVYAPAFTDDDIDRLLPIASHLSFNSFGQWSRFKAKIQSAAASPACAIRINPQHREVETELYDPCAPHSRLGVTIDVFDKHSDLLDGITGLHFHTLCELGSDALERTLQSVEQQFGQYFESITWINFGGGHHITRDDYDVDHLVQFITDFRKRTNLDVYLEPGEAVALNAGVLIATVLDIMRNDMDIAILDTSATAHMPDVLEMPYRPRIVAIPGNAEALLVGRDPGETAHTYRLGGLTCLAGDVIGDYAFDRPLRIGDKLVFADMAHYSMVKTTMFNGVPHPAIAVHNDAAPQTRIIRRFDFDDYKSRLS